MMRLDAERTTDLEKEEEDKLLYSFENFIASESPHVVILEDYNKGVLTEKVISKIVALCKKHNILITVEKIKNFPFLVYKKPLKATTPLSVPVLA